MWEQVSKEEMFEYIAKYPRRLNLDICRIGDPPIRSWNDFETGKIWPDSMVAKETLEELGQVGFRGLNTFWLRKTKKKHKI